MAAQHRRSALVARHLIEQALEFGDVAVDGLLEVAVAAIFAGDLVERFLSGRRVEALGEGLALAALIAIPHFGSEIAIHQPADVERQRLQGIAAALLRCAAARRFTIATARIRSVQQLGKPSIATLVGTPRRNWRRFRTARRGDAAGGAG